MLYNNKNKNFITTNQWKNYLNLNLKLIKLYTMILVNKRKTS